MTGLFSLILLLATAYLPDPDGTGPAQQIELGIARRDSQMVTSGWKSLRDSQASNAIFHYNYLRSAAAELRKNPELAQEYRREYRELSRSSQPQMRDIGRLGLAAIEHNIGDPDAAWEALSLVENESLPTYNLLKAEIFLTKGLNEVAMAHFEREVHLEGGYAEQAKLRMVALAFAWRDSDRLRSLLLTPSIRATAPMETVRAFYFQEGRYGAWLFSLIATFGHAFGIQIFLASLLASGLWLILLLRLNVFTPISARTLILAFVLGLALFFVALLDYDLLALAADIRRADWQSWLYSLSIIGPLEESLKALPLLLLLYLPRLRPHNPMGILLTAVAGGLGFATLEQVYYLGSHPGGIFFLRTVLSLSGHVMASATLGYLTALLIHRYSWPPWLAVIAAFPLPAILHGALDATLFLGWNALFFVAIISWLALLPYMISNLLCMDPGFDFRKTARLKSLRILTLAGLMLLLITDYLLTAFHQGPTFAATQLGEMALPVVLIFVFGGMLFSGMSLLPGKWYSLWPSGSRKGSPPDLCGKRLQLSPTKNSSLPAREVEIISNRFLWNRWRQSGDGFWYLVKDVSPGQPHSPGSGQMLLRWANDRGPIVAEESPVYLLSVPEGALVGDAQALRPIFRYLGKAITFLPGK